MEAGFLVALIITIASFMLIAGVVMRFMSSAEDKEAEILCHDSILMRAQSVINVDAPGVDAEIKIIPPMCKTIDKKIKGNREELKRQIADKMARCWWMFGQGKYEEILHGSDVDIIYDFGETKNKCFNCYMLMIDQDKIEGDPVIKGGEMTEFLNTEKYGPTNTTYLQYIQEQGGPGKVVFTAPAIIPMEAYAISMMPKNKNVDESEFWTGAGLVTAGVVVVGVVGVGAVCILTNVACVAVLSVAAAGVGEGAALTAGVAATQVVGAAGVTGSVLIAGAGAYTINSGYMKAMSTMYGEREVSSIYVGFSEVGQQMCGSEDIVGD